MSNSVSSLSQTRVVGSSTQKSILMYMADRASDDGTGIWSSKANMAADLEINQRTVQRGINKLIDSGLISEVGKRACKNGFTVEYSINLGAVLALLSTRETPGTVPPPAQDHPHPRHRTTPTPGTGPPKPPTEPPVEPPFIEPTQKSSKKRSTSLPDEWVPSDANIAHALSKNFTHEEINNEADRFRDHHLAKGTTFKDWNAGWRTWIGNARKFGTNRNMAGKASTGGYGQSSSIAGVVARREAERQN